MLCKLDTTHTFCLFPRLFPRLIFHDYHNQRHRDNFCQKKPGHVPDYCVGAEFTVSLWANILAFVVELEVEILGVGYLHVDLEDL